MHGVYLSNQNKTKISELKYLNIKTETWKNKDIKMKWKQKTSDKKQNHTNLLMKTKIYIYI